MSNQTGQGFKLRALLYSLYNGQPASLLDVVCLDWAIRKDLGAVVLAFGFDDPHGSTHFFYGALKSAVQAAGLWSWFVEADVVEH